MTAPPTRRRRALTAPATTRPARRRSGRWTAPWAPTPRAPIPHSRTARGRTRRVPRRSGPMTGRRARTPRAPIRATGKARKVGGRRFPRTPFVLLGELTEIDEGSGENTFSPAFFCSDDRAAPAIDVQRHAGDIPATFRAQEERGRRELLRLAV